MNYEQLKNSILQEAIEGRLVKQDPNDEPAAVLLDRIADEKKRLIKEKKIKRDKNESRIYRTDDGHWMERFSDKNRPEVCIDDEIPFDIPESWEWTRIQNVIELVNGRAFKKEELLSKGKYRVLRVGNFFTNQSWYYSDLELPNNKYCYKGDLLYAWSASFGPRIWEGEKTIFHYHIWNVKFDEKLLYKKYLYYFFLVDKNHLAGSTTGSTMIHVSMENMKPRLLPIPPLNEQKRIVERIDQVLPKVEEYGKAQDRLDALNSALPENLKASILQEAIEGRLVPQNPNDEPASKLLDRIAEEKAKLVKEKKIKADKSASRIYRTDDGHWMEHFADKHRTDVCIDDEIPFDIPESWEWQRFENVCIHNPSVEGKDEDDAAFMPMALIDEGVNGTYSYQIKKWKQIKNGFRRFQDGDFAFAKITPCFQNGKSILPHNLPNGIGAGTTELYVVRTYNNTILTKYIFYFVKSPYFMLQAKFKGTAGQQRVLTDYVLNKLFPVPPLQEQHRIVEKLESILPKINNITH